MGFFKIILVFVSLYLLETLQPVLQYLKRSGGKVLVKADVQEILHDGEKVHGVLVKKGHETYKIEAPMVISSAGLYNTFQKLLPPNVGENSYFHGICKNLKVRKFQKNILLSSIF